MVLGELDFGPLGHVHLAQLGPIYYVAYRFNNIGRDLLTFSYVGEGEGHYFV